MAIFNHDKIRVSKQYFFPYSTNIFDQTLPIQILLVTYSVKTAFLQFLNIKELWYTVFFSILWGAGVSIYSDSKSLTSWIPSLIVLPIFLSGIISSVAPNQKKFWMHVSVAFGLLAFIGGFDFLRGFSSELGPFEKPAAGLYKLMLLVTGGIFTFYNIKSFIAARENAK